mmetsp:Transcript_2534/g.3358  ORF Transcript_2534/g.3358 Transcript_2534/m.3358 type:complete len:279 (+) Transcript_2534:918-1754(+)
MGNVGEWSSMNKDGCSLQGLHQVGHNGVLHQHSQSTSESQVISCHWFTRFGRSNHHAPKAFSHVSQGGGQSQDSHGFRSHSDIKACFSGLAFFFWALSDGDLSQESVASIHDTVPCEGSWVKVQSHKFGNFFRGQVVGVGLVDAQLLQSAEHDWGEFSGSVLLSRAQSVEQSLILLCGFVEHSGFNLSSKKVVSSSDSVDVTGQVEVELFHRNDLRVATTSSSTFDSKSWSLTWLTKASKCFLVQVSSQRLGKTHSSGRLAFSKRSWIDTSNNDIFSI